MTSPIISVSHISKKYLIGEKRSYRTLRESISEGLGSMFKRPKNSSFWALKDVSFDLQQGEMMGIIGGNGAGKSTLLKILSRITPPTRGSVQITGRVASLLEVGTGFHPELTGRENIYFNGSLLGMKRKEIDQKFSNIVDFAGIEKFIDTPVKRYSSGMYVRLAFSVAAHLESEILLIDEVLAVGDQEFQKKCLGKMSDITTKQGRSVLFVSHNMSLVSKLCKRSVLLENGRITSVGKTEQVIYKYLNSKLDKSNLLINRRDRVGDGRAKIVNIHILKSGKKTSNSINTLGNYSFVFEYESTIKIKSVLVGFIIRNSQGVAITIQHNRLYGKNIDIDLGRGSFICEFESLPLIPGQYFITYSLMPYSGKGGDYIDSLENALSFTVKDNGFYPSWEIPDREHAIFLTNSNWRTK